MSYKAKEVPIYLPMEQYLMDDIGIATRCDLHKFALKHLYQQRRAAKVEYA
tara:strand:+ start:751 stop:903 length:153 start_codon:yes stop_codon:yes gene_type:complete